MLGLQIDDPAITGFTAVIQVGAIAAVVLFFWKDIRRIAVGLGARPGQARAPR